MWEATGDGPALPALSIKGTFNQALRGLITAAKPAGKTFPLHVEQLTRDQIVRVSNTGSQPKPYAQSTGSTSALDKALTWDTKTRRSVGKPVTTLVASTPATNQVIPQPKLEAIWTIKQGYSIQQQLTEMGKKAHWNVVWNYPKDIIADGDWTSHDDFPTTAEQIIKILAANGALIHYHTFTGNNTFLVYGTGASTP